MFDRVAIKNRAKLSFHNQYGMSLVAYLLFVFVSAAVSSFTFGIASLLITPPMLVGFSFFCIRVYRGETCDIGEMFTKGFSDFGRNLGGILYKFLFIFLWSLLLWIPGIIKAIAYSMTEYILADCPNVQATDAVKLSMRMTNGYKGDIFVMYLSFLGWWLLSGLTFGILGLVYVGPYCSLSFAGLYDDLKAKALQNGTIRADELG